MSKSPTSSSSSASHSCDMDKFPASGPGPDPANHSGDMDKTPASDPDPGPGPGTIMAYMECGKGQEASISMCLALCVSPPKLRNLLKVKFRYLRMPFRLNSSGSDTSQAVFAFES